MCNLGVKSTVSIPENALISRRRYLQDAKGSSFLDAVFLIHFYNRCSNWGGCPDIAPSEVLDTFDPAEYQLALARVYRLLANNLDVGMAVPRRSYIRRGVRAV
jgi:hypothetical protein